MTDPRTLINAGMAEYEALIEAQTNLRLQAEESRNIAQRRVGELVTENEDLRAQVEKLTPRRFPGDPGVGQYRVGWSLERGTASGWDLDEVMGQPWWNPKVSVIHDYARKSAKLIDRVSVAETFAAGFAVASLSCKLLGLGSTPDARFDAVINGSANDVIDDDAAWCKAQGKPIWLCIYHEPEDLTAARATKLRAATRVIALRFRAAGADNVVFQPIYQNPYTFGLVNGKPRRDFRMWDPDWNGTQWHTDRVCGLMGLDTYNPLPPSSGVTGPNRELAEMMDIATAQLEATGRPDVPRTFPEFGMGRINTANQDPPGGWPRWAGDAIPVIRARDVVLVSMWDNSDDVGRYRLTHPGKREAWDMFCAGAVG